MNLTLKRFRTAFVLLLAFTCFAEVAYARGWRLGDNIRRMRQRTQSASRGYFQNNVRRTGNRLGLVRGQPLRNIARCAVGAAVVLANGVMRVLEFCANVLEAGFVILANGVRMAVNALLSAGHVIMQAGRLVLRGTAEFLIGATVVLTNGVRIALGGRPIRRRLIANNGGYNEGYNQNNYSRNYSPKVQAAPQYQSIPNYDQTYSGAQGY